MIFAWRDKMKRREKTKGPGRAIREFTLSTLNDAAKRDDHCARITNKSLLYLGSSSSTATPIEFNASASNSKDRRSGFNAAVTQRIEGITCPASRIAVIIAWLPSAP
jgi:hypothetical protein